MLDTGATLAALPGVGVRLLNSPRLARADGMEHVLERKAAALIALLALDGPTQRSRVAACLWPGASESQARTNLRQRLYRLRQQAGCDGVCDDGALRLADDVGLDITEALRALRADAAAAAGELLGAHDYGEHEELGFSAECLDFIGENAFHRFRRGGEELILRHDSWLWSE